MPFVSFLIIFVFTLITHPLFLPTSPTFAQEIKNNDIFIDVGDMTITNDSGEHVTVSQTKDPSVSSEKHSPSTMDFSLTIKERILDYGELIPANPVSRATNFSIRNTSTPFYYVVSSENHPLRDAVGNTIPDTTCDNGSCTENRSALWVSPLVYGFGYHAIFDSEADFKQFPDAEAKETYRSVFMAGKSESIVPASVTVKVNVPASQPKGNYTNTIYYILVPGI